MENDEQISVHHFWFLKGAETLRVSTPTGQHSFVNEGVDLNEINKSLILQAMQQTGGNKTRAAKLLGISRTSLISRLKKYSIIH
jgi:transcriptional regulator with PAS, ATPase and Fis domain